jgi:8-oxo-dGTP pyrophosphatase MutT (NUDIX family)
MLSVEDIGQCLRGYAPKLLKSGGRRAGVSLVLRRADDALLFIERSRYPGDPWSGHLAFPGGGVEAADSGDLRRTAERETFEEVELSLDRAFFLGRLDDVGASLLPVVVSAFVYAVDDTVSTQPNAEVQRAFWVPLAHLCDPARRTVSRYRRDRDKEEEALYPGLDLLGEGEPVLWGLSYRLVVRLLALAGHTLPLAVEGIDGRRA